MAGAVADVLFKAEFDASGAIIGLKKVQSEASATKPKTDSAASSFKNLATAAAGAAVIVKLGGFLKDCASAAMESEQATAKLNAVYKATGGVVGMSTQQLGKLASEIQGATGVSDEMVMSAEAVLLTFRSIQGEAFPRTMKAAADLSAVFGQDLNGSVTMLGKALEDPIKGITSMTRVGVTFSEEQKKVIAKMVETNHLADAQAEILRVVELQVGGTAEAMGKTLAGQLGILNETWGDAKEAIGGFVTGAIAATGIVPALTSVLRGMTEGLTGMAGKTEVANTAQELTAHSLELLIPKRQAEIAALQEQMRHTDHSSDAYEAQKNKLMSLIEELHSFEQQLPQTTAQEDAAADAAKRVGDESEGSKKKVAELGDLLDQYYGEGKTYSATATIAADTSGASTTLIGFLEWVNQQFPPGVAREIALEAATAQAEGDLAGFMEQVAAVEVVRVRCRAVGAERERRGDPEPLEADAFEAYRQGEGELAGRDVGRVLTQLPEGRVAEILPPTLPTTVAVGAGTAREDAAAVAADMRAAVPLSVPTAADFAAGVALAAAETYADGLTGAVPGSATTTALFAPGSALGDAAAYGTGVRDAVPGSASTTALFAPGSAISDATRLGRDLAGAVPGSVTTEAAFVPGTTVADARRLGSDVLGALPPNVPLSAQLIKGSTVADAGKLGRDVAGAIPPDAATVTAKFADLGARAVIINFLGKVAKDFPPDKAAEITAHFRDAQARGDVTGFLGYVNTEIPAEKRQELTAAFVDVQARLDAQKLKTDMPSLVGKSYTTILQANPDPARTKANELAAELAAGAVAIPPWQIRLEATIEADEAKAQAEAEFKAFFDYNIAPLLADSITQGIVDGLAGEGIDEAVKALFDALGNLGRSMLKTFLEGIISSKDVRQSLIDAGVLTSNGRFNAAGTLSAAGGMVYQAGQQRGSRGMGALGGAMSGAGIGLMFGTVGAIVGAIIGGIAGYLTSGTRTEGYKIWMREREGETAGIRAGMWYGPTGKPEEQEMAREMLSKYHKAAGFFRDVLDMLEAPLGDLPAIEISLEAQTKDFSTFWRTFLTGTLPRAVFQEYKPALTSAMEAFGIETGRINLELAKFNTAPFEEAAQALKAWIGAIVAVRDTIELTGLSFEDFKARALEGPLEAWRRDNAKVQADLLRWSGQLSQLDTEEQVEQAGKMVQAINAQIDANAKLLATLDDLRQKYVVQPRTFDLAVGAGGSDMLERVDAVLSAVVTELADAATIEQLVAAAEGADAARQALKDLADVYAEAVADFTTARGELDALVAAMTPVQPLALEDALAGVQDLMTGIDQLAPADAAARVREVTALLSEQYEMQKANLEQITNIQESLAASWDKLFGKWAEGKLSPEEVMAQQQAALSGIVDQLAAAASPEEIDRLVRQAQELAGTLWDNLTSQIEALAGEGEDTSALLAQRDAVEALAQEIRTASEAQLETYRQQVEAEIELIKAAAIAAADILDTRASQYDEILSQVQAADAAIADALEGIGTRLDSWEAEIAASNELLDQRADELLAALTAETGARQDLIQEIDRTEDTFHDAGDATDDVIDGYIDLKNALDEARGAIDYLRQQSTSAGDSLSGAATAAGAMATNTASAATAANDAAAALRNVRDSDPTRATGRWEEP